MPVYADELLTSSALRLPIIRQVLDWVCHPEDGSSKLKVQDQEQQSKNQDDQQQQHNTLSRLLSLEQEDMNLAMANTPVSSSLPSTPKCPYSTVARNPAVPSVFQMPLHYPRYSKHDYEAMPEWQVDRLLEEYGLVASLMGSLKEKREYAIGAFLWSNA